MKAEAEGGGRDSHIRRTVRTLSDCRGAEWQCWWPRPAARRRRESPRAWPSSSRAAAARRPPCGRSCPAAGERAGAQSRPSHRWTQRYAHRPCTPAQTVRGRRLQGKRTTHAAERERERESGGTEFAAEADQCVLVFLLLCLCLCRCRCRFDRQRGGPSREGAQAPQAVGEELKRRSADVDARVQPGRNGLEQTTIALKG